MDKKIICSDCGKEFVFTENDQRFYEDHNYVPPKRCKDCRKKRKLNRKEN